MSEPELRLTILNDSTNIKSFDCEDQDLNEFLFEKAKDYKREFLATTFIIETEKQTVAYYSIFQDSLRVEEKIFQSNNAYKKFLKISSHPKRHLKTFPALKIGRLGIDKNFKNKGLGKKIVSSIIDEAHSFNDRQACKLVIVDAYSDSTQFYEKIGFQFLTENDKNLDTRQMFFNLTNYK